MKKSKFFFAAAYFVWAIGIAYMVLILFGPTEFILFNKRLFSGFLPFVGFVFVFMGIGLAKKGNALYNVEHGRAANYRPARTKAQKIMPWMMAAGFGIVAIVCIAMMLSGK